MYLPPKDTMVEKTFQRFSDVQRYMDITENKIRLLIVRKRKRTRLNKIFSFNKKERVNASSKTHSLFQVATFREGNIT